MVDILPKLRDLTTIRVGGKISNYWQVTTTRSLFNAVNEYYNNKTLDKMKVLGGGSNILPNDGDFSNPVLHLASTLKNDRNLEEYCTGDLNSSVCLKNLLIQKGDPYSEKGAKTIFWAGEKLFDIVSNFAKMSPLVGVPGSLGGAVVQNAGAYGVEISDFIKMVYVFDIEEFLSITNASEAVGAKIPLDLVYKSSFIKFNKADCHFSYRNSIFKRNSRYIVCGVEFSLDISDFGIEKTVKIKHEQLADALNMPLLQKCNSYSIREKVMELRKNKAMLENSPHNSQIDQQSCGSFFTNPIILKSDLTTLNIPKDCPIYPSNADNYVKLSAAFLIEHSGFHRGFALDGGSSAAISSKHTLAIVNRENSRTPGKDIRELSNYIIDKVYAKFGIKLEPEPVFW